MSNLFEDQVTHDNIYTSTYSLWGNSKYYDIKNLSPQNYCASRDNGSSANNMSNLSLFSSSPWQQAPPARDCLNRRIISRDALYEDPDNHENVVNEPSHLQTPELLPEIIRPSESSKNQLDKATVYDWTQFYWHKATEKLGEQEWGQSTSKIRRQVVGPSKIQKKLNKMLAKPPTMTKAESMMQKMGWQGGALGRSGDGIVEPIKPNAVYAQTKIGLGHSITPPLDLVKPTPSKVTDKEFFGINVLKYVYDFLKNNLEKELLFDTRLTKNERKRIHHLVHFMIMCDDVTTVDFESDSQMELLFQIQEKNCYDLHTESSGVHPNRQLCLYKLAPPHVYLIVPEDLIIEKKDLKTEIQEITKSQIKTKTLAPEPKVEETEPEEETNPFLISITRNLKKQKTDSDISEVQDPQIPKISEDPKVAEVPPPLALPMSKISSKIVEYFIEFSENKDFTEFKFMGPFTEEQFDAINEFLAQAVAYSIKVGDCHLASIFDSVSFRIEEDRTGNTVICKTKL